jgi:FkbM family methyltransferase
MTVKLIDRLLYRVTEVRNVGLRNTLANKLHVLRGRRGARGPFRLRSRYAAHPLWCRPGTTDLRVFHQIFGAREYSCLDDVTGCDLVIDCGAYVGYSSAYFLTRFPGAKVIAVEPDPDTFEMLRRNLAPYGDAVTPVRAGVWSHPCSLVLSEEPYGDGREWSRQVRECRPGEAAQLAGVDIASLLRQAGRDRGSVLKMDVERAEAVLFAAHYESWLDRVDNLVIELHDEECERVFFAAIAGRPFAVSRCGELTVCKRSPAGGQGRRARALPFAKETRS